MVEGKQSLQEGHRANMEKQPLKFKGKMQKEQLEAEQLNKEVKEYSMESRKEGISTEGDERLEQAACPETVQSW